MVFETVGAPSDVFFGDIANSPWRLLVVSPGMNEHVKEDLCAAAIKIKTINYHNNSMLTRV